MYNIILTERKKGNNNLLIWNLNLIIKKGVFLKSEYSASLLEPHSHSVSESGIMTVQKIQSVQKVLGTTIMNGPDLVISYRKVEEPPNKLSSEWHKSPFLSLSPSIQWVFFLSHSFCISY